MSVTIKTVTISPECEGRTATITSADNKNWAAATAVKRNSFIVHHKALNTQPSAQTATSDRLHCVPLQEYSRTGFVCLSVCLLSNRPGTAPAGESNAAS